MRMDLMVAFGAWLCISLAVVLMSLLFKPQKSIPDSRTMPPRPPGWPLIGNILDLGKMPHVSMAHLSEKYGPVFWLKLGAMNTVVVSSAEAAMDMFKNHDQAFSDRNNNEALRVNDYYQSSIAIGQYKPHWRMLRRMCTMELFTAQRINDTEYLREKCISKLMKWMWDEVQQKGSVKIARLISFMIFNVSGNMLLSRDLVDAKSKQGNDFFDTVGRILLWAGKPNVADFFPSLRWLDVQRIKRNMKRDMDYALDFAGGFVKERIHEDQQARKNTKKDFLDVMLEFEGNPEHGETAKMSVKQITIMLLELFVGFTDSATSTLEWAMSELLRNPNTMRKLQMELDQVVGQEKKIKESDIENLPYLQAVVKETMRLHPAIPLLLPRRAMEDTQFKGYLIPRDTQILVNIWAIGRDSASWEDPVCFKPERFLGSRTDNKGHHYQFLTFGSGRRICPGMPLAQRTLHLTLGSFIQAFDWSLEEGITPETMDMSEKFGISLRKDDPLKVVLKLRSGVKYF